MARAFSEIEKTQIQQQLLETGRELFGKYGLKKTSIEDLTRPVGIAKSSFYLFFDSKEALYLALLLAEGPKIQERIMNASFLVTINMREAIVRFLHAIIDEIETNQLTRRLITHPEDLELLARRFSPEQMELKIERSIQLILPYIEQGQATGQIIDGKPEIIAGAIRSVTMLVLYKDSIGKDVYPEVLDMVINMVAKGLTTPE